MRKILASILGLLLAANGVFMLADPTAWYGAVPGVAMTARSTCILCAISDALIAWPVRR